MAPARGGDQGADPALEVIAPIPTYFVAARVAAQVDGDPTEPLARVQNIARARVTVTC